MATKIALAGNPNSGKTTLFNALTGSNQFVGNWPGVTVEKKEGFLKGQHREVQIIDLPGIYSLSPYTPEEVIARNYLENERPDAILNIVDGTNLERNLYLTTQLLEFGIPVVIAVNMIDIVEKNGDVIDLEKLSEAFGCRAVMISALKGTDVLKAAQLAVGEARARAVPRRIDLEYFTPDDEDDAESADTAARYAYIDSVIRDCVKIKNRGRLSVSDKIDRVVTNRFAALPIFAVVMFIVYFVSVTSVGAWVTDWTNETLFGDIVPTAVEGFLTAINCADWLQGLVLDGIIAGVGAVIGFVPQMLILFIFLAFLESCGYMARIAFIMDRIFRRFGLSGKSFIPILIGTGCGVPGIMASRTIDGERDRRMTVMTTTFIPCSAKLPIIALIAGALFGGAWWVAPSAYFIGIAAIICSGIILKKTKLFAGDVSPFVMELPAYHLPTVVNILRSMWERGWSFIKKAGTIILLATVFVWFASSFGFEDGRFGMVDMADSVLAKVGSAIAWIFSPLGWGEWKSAVAAITGLIAKENVVGTFGILYGFAEVAEDGAEVWSALSAAMAPLAAYSFLVFNLLCAPCFAAMGAIRREMNSAKWFWIAIGYQCGFAYIVALCVYQLGRLFGSGVFGVGTVVAFVLVAAFLFMLLRREKKSDIIKA
ncbi:MAG: ferrous iron transport protein B, partial [Oscillospiraceae bacterium]|nr:ferrous iron transport protein B [Oscillospiraceae bacterium]